MPFLLLNQQRQSTEGFLMLLEVIEHAATVKLEVCTVVGYSSVIQTVSRLPIN